MPKKKKQSSEAAVREIRRRARRRFSAEEKIRIVLEGLRGEESIAALNEDLKEPYSRSHFKLENCTVLKPTGNASSTPHILGQSRARTGYRTCRRVAHRPCSCLHLHPWYLRGNHRHNRRVHLTQG